MHDATAMNHTQDSGQLGPDHHQIRRLQRCGDGPQRDAIDVDEEDAAEPWRHGSDLTDAVHTFETVEDGEFVA
jgi:hypothetical protein